MAVLLVSLSPTQVRADEPKPVPSPKPPTESAPAASKSVPIDPPTVPPADPVAAQADAGSPAQREQPSSLDELLGLEQEPGDRGAEAGADKTREEDLTRALDQQAPGQALAEALVRMGVSAELLDVRFDAGLGTQRVQQEVLAKLDELIEMAKNMSSSSGSSSSSSAGSPRSTSRSQSAPPKQAGAGKPNSSAQRNPNPANSQEGDSPPLQQGDINTVIDETRQEWGNLPPRVRDMMLQGRTSRFSSLYQRLTEEYYKRLAEETAR
jgi:hypothetical protein